MTDIPWGSDEAKAFITNVGLITSTGALGDNIMAAEWTHHISYSPGLIAVCISKDNKGTALNIHETKQFGVNIAAEDHTMLASIAGDSSGKNIDKIKVLEEVVYVFSKGKHIKAPMVEGAVLQVECKLVREVTDLGSHTIFIGEALSVTHNKNKESLAFHRGKYYKMNETIPKPPEETREKISKLVKKHQRI